MQLKKQLNLLRMIDPNGEGLWDVVTGQQTWSSYVVEIGQGAQTLYESSSVARTAMDHPVGTGVTVGLAAGAGYSLPAGITYGLTELGILSTQADKINRNTINAVNSNLNKISNIINHHLQVKDYSGFIRDLSNRPVWSHVQQRYFQHYKEVMDARRGLTNTIQRLTNIAQNNKLDTKSLNAINNAINSASQHINKIDKILKSFNK